MKLRIRENSIRLRLTKSEVAEIAEKGLVENRTEFGNNQIFVYSLKTSASTPDLQANFENGRIEIIVPQSVADNWTITEEVGIYGNHENLQIAIEKDFTCLTPRAGDEDSDTFPHPQEKHNC